MTIFSQIILALLSYVCCITLIPRINQFGIRKNITDIPNKRKRHKVPLVRLGGVAIFLSFLIFSIIAFIFSDLKYFYDFSLTKFILILFTSTLIFLIGLFDDIFSISPFLRLFLQFLIALICWSFGIRLETITFTFFGNSMFLNLGFLSIFLTLIWIVGVTNAINWIDGLDGLAASISSIAFFTIFLLSTQENSYLGLISIILIGSCVGYLKFNVFPAKILMGDCGSNFLGFILSQMTILLSSNQENINGISFMSTNIFLALGILFFPLSDMLFVMINRILKGNSVFFPDRSHLHFRILNYGLSHRETVSFLNIYATLMTLVFIIISY